MANLTDNAVFRDLVNKADQKVTAALTDSSKRGKLEIAVTYTANETGSGGTITIERIFNAIESVTDTTVSDVTL